MHFRVYIGLGSNLGDRFAHLERAVSSLGRFLHNREVSPVFETLPLYNENQPLFLNQVVSGDASLSLYEWRDVICFIQKGMGRVSSLAANEPRPIDIDLIDRGGRVESGAGLHLPHPKCHERLFVLEPLFCLNPVWIHPIRGGISELIPKALGDVRKI